ncbi:Na(+)-translocating NADH-quinone reductase subunit B [uncultured Flavonifractor sp.]|uniref:Ion-translocating oxidoreductase complex subunit D n=1 Tax=Flintibacter hominis TaxID=2763048 RepID=A0A8J6IXV7_9FIRM|nr:MULTISPECIES: RnfABCDGE type electron transport complex subunit D [Eubacteriales]MBS5589662.1 RnfABCDGE type electron transport complex subunit D [Clostridiales bacterium]SCH08868.1 Na(+)-translocating NADH-quinone reductase subunit B [uncultured Clostridium sp.]SCI48752.1 Na(+)-translocating NADH-quinone reductase subunit B [uncultured Flavonifractor sp.]MBC5722545.1 RnfABCDGE type electron transport complex subunit D [Flintibacter hominis]MCH1979618.1 RnfABCDGE type electron transport com
MANKLIVTAAPHITSADSTQKIMQRVCIALVPTLIASVFIFGINSLILTAITVAACVFFEWGYCKMVGREVPIADFSAVVTGLLLAFNLPASLPWWMAIVGAFIAIVIVKQLFGGMGYNFANPAIVARIALAVGFASRMASYPKPENGIDALASATPLAVFDQLGSSEYVTLLLGNHGGVLGETCAITILIGGIYLIATKVISPVIPVTYLATVAVLSLVAGRDPIVQLLSGGLMLGAFFMATDYVTSPTTNKGKIIFGLGLGIITCAIRFLGTMNEGVSFAILLMNLLVPYIEVNTRQDKLGIAKVKKGGAAK